MCVCVICLHELRCVFVFFPVYTLKCFCSHILTHQITFVIYHHIEIDYCCYFSCESPLAYLFFIRMYNVPLPIQQKITICLNIVDYHMGIKRFINFIYGTSENYFSSVRMGRGMNIEHRFFCCIYCWYGLCQTVCRNN